MRLASALYGARTAVLVAAVLLGALVVGSGRAAASSHHRHNIKAHPNFLAACAGGRALSHACIDQSIKAIEHARAKEHLHKRKLVLPRNYRSLTRAQQTFVVINLERVDRGLRPIKGMVPTLNVAAQLAAGLEVDPTPGIPLLRGLGVRLFKTLWARDYGVLASDYEWMYDDGYSPGATTNVVCSYAGAKGCWSHRRGMLQRFKGLPLLLAGVGASRGLGGTDSVTAILTGGYGTAHDKPHFTYTWRKARAHGADNR